MGIYLRSIKASGKSKDEQQKETSERKRSMLLGRTNWADHQCGPILKRFLFKLAIF